MIAVAFNLGKIFETRLDSITKDTHRSSVIG